MLETYLASVVIWFIILHLTSKFCKEMRKAKEIDLKKYIKDKEIKGKLSFAVISFIPVIRLIVWGTMLFVIFATEDMLDKLFGMNKEEK